MSLVVAHKTDSNIILVADTMLSDNRMEETTRPRSGLPDEYGILKLAIVRDNLAIGFAGGALTADAALRRITSNMSVNQVVDLLLEVHNQSSRAVDFVVAEAPPEPRLFLVKNGRASEDSGQVWVGSDAAYRVFQQGPQTTDAGSIHPSSSTSLRIARALDDDTASDEILSGMRANLDRVIVQGGAEGVGGIATTIAFDRGAFQFLGELCSFRRSLEPEEIDPAGEWRDVDFLDASAGSFSIETVQCESSAGKTIAVHQFDGEVGFFFDRRDGGFAKPVQVSQVDPLEFPQILNDRFEANCPGFIKRHSAIGYLRKCEALVRGGELPRATRLSTLAISANSGDNLLPHLHRLRAWIYLLSGNDSQAIEDATIAINHFPQDRTSHHIRGNARGRIGEQRRDLEILELARLDLEQAVSLDQTLPEARNHLERVRGIQARIRTTTA